MKSGALFDLKVIDLGHLIAGPYCAALLAGLGAEVIKVERPGSGDGARRMGPFPGDEPHLEKSGYFNYLNQGKLGITLDLKSEPGKDAFRQLVAESDVLIENFAPRVMASLALGYEDLREINPALVMTSISNYGATGPYRDYKGFELTLSALSGMQAEIGEPDREPVKLGGFQLQFQAGLTAAFATMTGVSYRSATGIGQHIDHAILETAATMKGWASTHYQETGQHKLRNGARFWRVPIAPASSSKPKAPSAKPKPKKPKVRIPGPYIGILPCKDGEVCIDAEIPSQFFAMCEMIGRPELKDDPRFKIPVYVDHHDELDAIVAEHLKNRTKHEIFEEASLWRIPCGVVNNMRDLLHDPQHRARGFFVEVDHPVLGKIEYPGHPFVMSETPWKQETPAPLLGQHNREILVDRLGLSEAAFAAAAQEEPSRVTARPRPRADTDRREATESGDLALRNIRVLDHTIAWAGPQGTQLLADMGAEVIKVESCDRPDMMRGGGRMVGVKKPWEQGAWYLQLNRNKRAITLDLSNDDGRELYLKMVANSDVVMDNFTSRVMPNLGLDYDDLVKVKPDIIVLHQPGYGSSGPYRDAPAFGDCINAFSGLHASTGYASGRTLRPGIAYSDPTSGFAAALAVLSALHYRSRTGKGQLIDVSHLEITSKPMDGILDFAMNGRLEERIGNRDTTMAPQGCYPCRGEDRWVVLTIADDEDWAAFGRVIGSPEWTRDPRFATAAGRQEHHDELDQLITAVTTSRDGYEWMGELQRVGVAAAPVLNPGELLDDPHYAARDFYEESIHPVAGSRRLPGMLYKMSHTPGRIRTPAPLLGQDNQHYLGEILGLSDNDLQRLSEDGVIGNVPSYAKS